MIYGALLPKQRTNGARKLRCALLDCKRLQTPQFLFGKSTQKCFCCPRSGCSWKRKSRSERFCDFGFDKIAIEYSYIDKRGVLLTCERLLHRNNENLPVSIKLATAATLERLTAFRDIGGIDKQRKTARVISSGFFCVRGLFLGAVYSTRSAFAKAVPDRQPPRCRLARQGADTYLWL